MRKVFLLLSTLLAVSIVPLSAPPRAVAVAAPAAIPILQPAPAMTPAAPVLAGDGAAPIFLAQCLPPCLSCQPGFFCGRNANGCLVCMRCTNPDPRFCPSGG